MENVIESIRAAIAGDATPEAKAVGATACRAILAILEGTVLAKPFAARRYRRAAQRLADRERGLRAARRTAEQLLDLAIQRSSARRCRP